MTNIQMKIRLIFLHVLSFLTILVLIMTVNQCKDYIGYESLGDVGLILVLSPILLFVLGTIRLFLSIDSGIKLIYRFQEYIYGLSIFALLFLISIIDSMLLGVAFSMLFILSSLMMTYLLKTNYLIKK